MGLDEPHKLDVLSVDATTATIVMTVIDEEDWVDVATHASALDRKIGRYLDAVVSGEVRSILERSGRTGAKNMSIRIRIIARVQPPAEAVELLSRMRDECAKYRVGFGHEVRPGQA